MSKELVQYLSSEDLEWFGRHLELAGVTGEPVPPPNPARGHRESWSERTEREFKETAVKILERQQAKHQALIEKFQQS